MIPSVTMASFIHHRSVHGKSTVLVVLADNMTLGPPIHWIIFFVVGVIGLGPLLNLLDRFTIECIVWDLLFGSSSLEILLEDSISWLKVLFFQVFPFFLLIFGYIHLIVALVPFVFGFSMHLLGCYCALSFGCAMFECGGVLVSTRSTLTTLVTLVSYSCSCYGTMGH
jgi:hypothetical protein